MGQDSFRIQVTDDAVDASWDDDSSTGQRIALGLFMCGLALLLSYKAIFGHGKNSGLLTFILNHPVLVREHVDLLYMNIAGIVLILITFGSIFVVGVRGLFPSGDRLHCDHSTFTIAKIAFWSLGDRWKVQSALPSEVSQARYGVVQSGRGGKLYGIRAEVRGKSWRVFAGIDASEAKRILQGLSRMGVDVRFGREMSLDQST